LNRSLFITQAIRKIMTEKDRKLIVLSMKWYDFRIHKGILDYAKKQGWDVIANPHESFMLDVPEADGMILMIGPSDVRRARLAKQSTVPVMDLGAYSSLPLPRVFPDNVMAGRMAAEEFLSRNFTRFSVFSTRSHWYVDERRDGFAAAVRKSGFTCETLHLPQTDVRKGVYSPDGTVRETLETWLTESEKPLAIYTIEDESAAMLMRVCHMLGIAVPEQVALIGTNNDPVICPYTEVPLSSIDMNWEEVGYQAAAQLDTLIQGKKLEKELVLVPPKGVVPRKSSDIIALADLRVAMALSYIKENCGRHITVSEIAQSLEVPMRTLQWAFQKSLNCSIQDQISKRRIERIKDMLENTDRKVGQIAGDLGFSSEQYMNHFFTKTQGQTPNEYRSRGGASCLQEG